MDQQLTIWDQNEEGDPDGECREGNHITYWTSDCFGSVSAAHRKLSSVRFLAFSPHILLSVPLDHTGAQGHKPKL